MALVKCPECGNEISDKAKSCPTCGYLIKRNDPKNRLHKVLISIILIIVLIVGIIITIIFTTNDKKTNFNKLEDEIFIHAKELQDTYGKISIDCAKIYCDGKNQYIIIYYYGLGKNYDTYGDTYAIYVTNQNNETDVTDPNGDVSELSNQFMNVLLANYEKQYNEYKYANNIITYEEFKEFKEGYVDEFFFETVNEKLK